VNKSNYLTTIIGLVASTYVATAFLPMTAWAELYVFNGNPLIGITNPTNDNPVHMTVDSPTLEHGTLVVPDPVTLPPEPTPAKPAIRAERQFPVRTQTITGLLYRVAAIGGETTGWAIGLEEPLKLRGKRMREINVAADSRLLEPLQDKQVQVRGQIIWRQGIERGRYPVMMLESIHEMH